MHDHVTLHNHVTQQIRDYIIRNFLFDDPSVLPPDDASLLRLGVIDSTGVLDLVLFLEDTFGIVVADEDVTPSNFDTVKRLATYAESRLAATAA